MCHGFSILNETDQLYYPWIYKRFLAFGHSGPYILGGIYRVYLTVDYTFTRPFVDFFIPLFLGTVCVRFEQACVCGPKAEPHSHNYALCKDHKSSHAHTLGSTHVCFTLSSLSSLPFTPPPPPLDHHTLLAPHLYKM